MRSGAASGPGAGAGGSRGGGAAGGGPLAGSTGRRRVSSPLPRVGGVHPSAFTIYWLCPPPPVVTSLRAQQGPMSGCWVILEGFDSTEAVFTLPQTLPSPFPKEFRGPCSPCHLSQICPETLRVLEGGVIVTVHRRDPVHTPPLSLRLCGVSFTFPSVLTSTDASRRPVSEFLCIP